MLTPHGMSALETAAGAAIGVGPGANGVPANGDPAEALEDAIVPALAAGPCLVSFSGGRDSSVVLAGAAAAARREGLSVPVPVTLRFPLAPGSDESAWQERVVSHLGLEDWVRIDIRDELDFVGPVARDLLAAHGPFYPANAHLVAPMLGHGAGGSLLGGIGGDEIFGLWTRRRLADLASGRARPRPRDIARVAGAAAPQRLRAAALRRRVARDRLPWLREPAQAELDAAYLRELARSPARWDRHVNLTARHRSVALAVRDIGRIAAAGGVRFHAPLLDPVFRAALARAGGWRGWGDRSATLEALFGHWLPEEVMHRRDKAIFNAAFFTGETRRFAERWSGGGLDPSIVDGERLRQTWRDAPGDYRSALLLQSAWLHDGRGAAC